jgi:uncharacterized protein (TIGR03437 family)
MAAILALLCAVTSLAQQSSLTDAASAFFDDRSVREIRIYFEDPNWYNVLLQGHNSAADPYFPCRFQYGATVINRIGCRFKGNSSSRRNGLKKPFKLDFNVYDDAATFLGLKKLNLNNGDLQPDMMREKLLHDFAGKYIASLRSVFVKLYVNDAYYGLYLAVEQPDKTMMKSRFGDNEDGNLYEAGEMLGMPGGQPAPRPDLSYLGPDPAPYRRVYELKTNEPANDYSGLIEFLDILNNTPAAELPARLEPVCDVENWLYGMAINNLFVNLDSYLGVAAEYYLYDRSRDGKFTHMQWDHNESFGTTGDGTPRIANPFTTDIFYLPVGGPGGATQPRPLLTKLWGVNAYRRFYLRTFARFLREGFNPDAMGARVTQLADLIRNDYYADPNKTFTNAQFDVALNNQITSGNLVIYGVNQFVRERHNYLRNWLNSQAQPSDVRLNEIVAANNGAYKDEAGDADPWVELHNLGPGPVTLNNFYLTDDAANPAKWQLPARTLVDGEFLIIWLDGEPGEGDTHASFRPQAAGGKLHLFSAQTQIDDVSYPALASSQSYIRLGHYGERWATTFQPTPAVPNPAAGSSTQQPPTQGTGQLLVNEIMADNKTVFQDPDEPGAYDDWFEVFNPGTTAVDMSGMHITDNLSNPTKWKVPNGVTIPARGYLVFIADDNQTAQGPRHTSFSLNADGEAVAIYQTDGRTLIDSVNFGVQQEDVSFGRITDGDGSLSIFRPATPGAPNTAAYANWLTNAASFATGPVAPEAIASLFGVNLSAGTVVAPSTPLPTTLGGVTVTVTDRLNVTRNAPLFFVSQGQVNLQIPADTAEGRARVTVRRQDGTTVAGDLLVDRLGPGLFAANANGLGIGAMVALRITAAGAQTFLPVFNYDAAAQRFVPVPVGLGAETDKLYLIIFGTGIRGERNLADVKVEVGNQEIPVLFAGAQGELVGLDQVNVGPLPRSLAGKGSVEVVIRVDGRRANRVTLTIQ